MSEDGGPPSKRIKTLKDDLEKMSREELLQKILDQETQHDTLMTKQPDDDGGGEDGTAVAGEDKLKQQQVEASRRENVLVMRLTSKEQELQDYLNQIQELKQSQTQSIAQLRNMLLDPAINLMFQRMKKEMDSCKEKLEQAQNDLAAWKFTPDSQTGKRLMAKCRMLLQENEELGKVISAGRTAKLEGEIALEKKFVEEMKKSQAETDDFLVEMDEDLEGMQSTIYLLQQQLKEAKDELAGLRDENSQLRQQQATRGPLSSTHHSPPPNHDTMDTTEGPDGNRDSGAITDTGSPVKQGSGPRTTGSPTGNGHSTGRTTGPPRSPLATATMPELRTASPPYSPSNPTPDKQPPTDSSPPPSQQQPPHRHQPDGPPSSAANGDHVAMETDMSEEQPSSCDEEAEGREHTSRSITTRHSPPPSAGAPPRPRSPSAPDLPASERHHNHAPCRTSQSSDGAFTMEATDASSDDWSPSNQSKTSGMGSDDDQKRPLPGPFRTEVKGGGPDRLQNGLLTTATEKASVD